MVDPFFDGFDSKSGMQANAPVPTSIRILVLDHNFIGKK